MRSLDDVSAVRGDFTPFDPSFSEFDSMAGGGVGRQLAGEKIVIDFTVLSMVVFVLGLLMLVELLRHKIDDLAKTRPFYTDALEAVYRELSILGIVEAVVFIVHHYYEDLNLRRERVFMEVHFTLFFVAIINAVQGVFLYLLTVWKAGRQWTLIEKMDLDHYVAIRRKFDVVDEQMKQLEKRFSLNRRSSFASNDTVDDDDLYKPKGMRERMTGLIQMIWYPSLKRQHDRLLVQIRFHELRIHFLETHGLPPKFKVSNYLMLNLQDEFCKLVHISTVAWLSLLACANLIFFTMGITATYSEGNKFIGEALSAIYVGYNVFFIVISVFVYTKVQSIFLRVMRDEKWIRKEGEDEVIVGHGSERANSMMMSMATSFRFHENDATRRAKQLGYFWFGNPRFIVAAAQFMLFGYAIAFSTVLVFSNTTIKSTQTLGWWGWYILVPTLCFICFLWLWTFILPKYTQCVSLGDLAQKKNLLRAEARFKLEEEKLKRQQELDHKEAEKLILEAEDQLPKESMKVARPSIFKESKNSTANKSTQQLLSISTLVKKPTALLPSEDGVSDRRRRRKKSVSDGVAAMRLFSSKSFAAEEALNTDLDTPAPLEINAIAEEKPRTERRRRLKSASAGVLQMSQMSDTKKDTASEAGGDKKGKSLKETKFELPSVLEDIPARAFNRAESVGSGETNPDGSDDMSDGVPEIMQKEKEESDTIPFFDKCRNMFLSEKYRVTSFVLGPLLLFYFINIRIETILIDSCTIENNMNTWNALSRENAFWLEVIWYCLFISESIFVCMLFGTKNVNPPMIITGIFDIILSATCLALLIAAERRRCCECTGSEKINLSFAAESTDDECEVIECCPVFGTRLCGGIGNIELATSIIVLRPFRFMLGNMMCSFWESCCTTSTSSSTRANESTVVDKTEEEHSSHGNDSNILDMWIAAVTKHPEIVEKHGMFSGYLLEVMLGVDPLPDENQAAESSDTFSEVKSETARYDDDILLKNVQSVIQAGKMMTPTSFRRSNSSSGGSILERNSSNGALDMDDDMEEFAHPASALIRSMRRCQCMLLPLLDEWTTVDVVLTKYELVWFDATKASHIFEDRDIKVRETLRNAIKTTKGGKGLRLCDIANGRITLGRISLSDIDNIKVQRLPPLKSASSNIGEVDEERNTVYTSFRREFWMDGDSSAESKSPFTHMEPQRRWDQQNQDKLRIHTGQGSLYLRFLADLCREEMVEEKNGQSDDQLSKREGALLWCQTIAHLVDISQLKQKLPHFGQELDEELRDFFQTIDRKGKHH